MKFLTLVLLISVSPFLKAGDLYRTYLLAKALQHSKQLAALPSNRIETNLTCLVPRYEIPKGNVFCRLEDKLTRATKVWIKVGVK